MRWWVVEGWDQIIILNVDVGEVLKVWIYGYL